MKSEWTKFNPKDPQTYPRENSRLEIKNADGSLSSGGFLRGHFLQGGVISASGVGLAMRWRYVQ
jgi:hypothetical protein